MLDGVLDSIEKRQLDIIKYQAEQVNLLREMRDMIKYIAEEIRFQRRFR